MYLRTLTGIALAALSGCATCRDHPVACTVATAIVAGSIAASVEHHHDQRDQHLATADYGLRTHCTAHGDVVAPGGCY